MFFLLLCTTGVYSTPSPLTSNQGGLGSGATFQPIAADAGLPTLSSLQFVEYNTYADCQADGTPDDVEDVGVLAIGGCSTRPSEYEAVQATCNFNNTLTVVYYYIHDFWPGVAVEGDVECKSTVLAKAGHECSNAVDLGPASTVEECLELARAEPSCNPDAPAECSASYDCSRVITFGNTCTCTDASNVGCAAHTPSATENIYRETANDPQYLEKTYCHDGTATMEETTRDTWTGFCVDPQFEEDYKKRLTAAPVYVPTPQPVSAPTPQPVSAPTAPTEQPTEAQADEDKSAAYRPGGLIAGMASVLLFSLLH